ncbi:MAG: GuaB3 family IMP dehydrogenase-related protein [Actinomycetota bacterium]|nr:GuaB3 family IMP dehydrogenase-related protein [Actinomycetota bacterium]
MRDLVEIGMGRGARPAYDFDDVQIVPSRRTRSSWDVSTAWQIDAYRFDIPLVTHPTDAIVSPAMAMRIGELGGLGVLNAEGLWARHSDVDKLLFRLASAMDEADEVAAVRLLQQWHSAPIRVDLLTEAIGQVAGSGVTVAARVSPQHARELAPNLVAAGVEILVVQGTIVSAEHVSRRPGVEPLNLVEFIASLDVPVVAGGVGDYRTAMHLMRTGAAGVIVGYGAGTSTSTGDVLGIGVPMATAVADAAAARRDYLDETGGRYVHVIADGGVRTSGDIAKAIGCGADAVMLGEPLAAAAEAPGNGLYWTAAAAHPSLPRSHVTEVPDGSIALDTLLFGPSCDPSGTVNLFGGLRRAMAKTGYSDLKEFQKVGLTVRG